MKKEVIFTRFSGKPGLNADRQREELHAKLGKKHEIAGDYSDLSPGSTAVKELFDAIAMGMVDVLVCSDLNRLIRRLSPQIIMAIREAGLLMVTADGTEIGMADLVAHTLINQMPKTFVEAQSELIKKGKRASKAAGPKKRPSPKK